MQAAELYQRYQDLRRFVGWTEADQQRVQAIAGVVEPHFPQLVDDFYEEIERHPAPQRVITGGAEQVERLKGTLTQWLTDLFRGPYGEDYVLRRWRVGFRHVLIGLEQVYTNAALSRLRIRISQCLEASWAGTIADLLAAKRAIDRLLDLDLAIIEMAYQTAYQERQQEIERLSRLTLIVSRQRTEQRFRQLAENIDQVFWVCSDDCREILYISPAYEKIWGRSCASLHEQPLSWLETIHRDDRPRVERAFFHAREAGQFDEEYRIVRADGEIRWIHDRLFPFREEGTARNLLGGIATDVTERRAMLQRTMQAERLAAIGQTMAGLAHESRNALQRSRACLEMLALEVHDRPQALDLVARTTRAQEHLAQLYEEVRQYAAPVVLRRERVNIVELWHEVWADVVPQHAAKAVQLREELNGCELYCEIDRFSIGQVFRNLLENSLDVAPTGSEICFRCDEVRGANGPVVRIAIRDQGPGMTAEQQARIFEPFFTTKTKGTGLGMAIAQRIADAHRGQIQVGDCSSRGTEIIVTLPRGDT